MSMRFEEMMNVRQEPRLDESTIELFRQYLKEVVMGGAYSGTSLLSWSDN